MTPAVSVVVPTYARPQLLLRFLALTSVLIPPLAVFWRLAGAWHFRVAFA